MWNFKSAFALPLNRTAESMNAQRPPCRCSELRRSVKRNRFTCRWVDAMVTGQCLLLVLQLLLLLLCVRVCLCIYVGLIVGRCSVVTPLATVAPRVVNLTKATVVKRIFRQNDEGHRAWRMERSRGVVGGEVGGFDRRSGTGGIGRRWDESNLRWGVAVLSGKTTAKHRTLVYCLSMVTISRLPNYRLVSWRHDSMCHHNGTYSLSITFTDWTVFKINIKDDDKHIKITIGKRKTMAFSSQTTEEQMKMPDGNMEFEYCGKQTSKRIA